VSLWDKFKNTTFYRSVYRNDYPDTPRNQVLVILNSVVLHLHPVKLPRRTVRVSYTWGLGGLSLLMFLILTLTGVWLMFYYVPAVPNAYFSMKLLETHVIFGMFARNMHRWAAHGMVIATWLHMTRVFLTGSYKSPREFNWAIGVVLLLMTILLSFTGYLLPWDQLAYWAIQVGSNMAGSSPVIGIEANLVYLGGFEIGPATLIRWYTLHVIFLPLAAIVLMAMHFWRIRKDGGISTPIPYDEDGETEQLNEPRSAAD
jgi:quinol-cytochrome oxidoreductase complex cytochrome b subunit